MPSYNTATTAMALGTDPKWLDNLLSHNEIAGVSSARQGVARRLTLPAVETIALARELCETLGASSSRALALAAALLADGGGSIRAGAIRISVDRAALQSSVTRGLAHAVEIAPHPVRGRPRRAG